MVLGRARRSLRFSLLVLIACLLALLAGSRQTHAESGRYIAVRVEGVINPVKARLVERAVNQAKQGGARFLLVSIDTPGGLVSSMQEIVGSLTNAGLPVITFVAPRSAEATSAGAFILLAGDVAAMAPGTRLGAAHPVAAGEALDGVLDEKVTNSLSSLIRSLAERRSRPTEPAEDMVRLSTSYTAEQAQELELVELVVAHEEALLKALDGRELRPGQPLRTSGLERVEVTLNTFDRVLDALAEPTLASLLLSLGVLALLYELGSPGIGAGGAIGAVLLVLGLLGSSVLPVELSAVALLLIGFAAIALEVKLPTHGVLGGAGVIAVVIGGLLVVDPDDYFGGVTGVNPALFVPVVLTASLGLFLLVRVARRALTAPPLTGTEALVNREGRARSTFGRATPSPRGQVFVDGARWEAETEDAEIKTGDAVRVVAVLQQPTRLVVQRINGQV
jgi:membrane-bound serine protease (ClpP class)